MSRLKAALLHQQPVRKSQRTPVGSVNLRTSTAANRGYSRLFAVNRAYDPNSRQNFFQGGIRGSSNREPAIHPSICRGLPQNAIPLRPISDLIRLNQTSSDLKKIRRHQKPVRRSDLFRAIPSYSDLFRAKIFDGESVRDPLHFAVPPSMILSMHSRLPQTNFKLNQSCSKLIRVKKIFASASAHLFD